MSGQDMRKLMVNLNETPKGRLNEGWLTKESHGNYTLQENYQMKNMSEFYIFRYKSADIDEVISNVFVSNNYTEAKKIYDIVIKLHKE